MGLDMYLNKAKKSKVLDKKIIVDVAENLYNFKSNNLEMQKEYDKLKDILEDYTYLYNRWGDKEETYLYKNVAYWRKANEIHKWIYENCAEEEQKDYDTIFIEKEQIEELLKICKDLYLRKDTISQSELKEILPTKSGFFFGSTDYDEYYWEDIESTINQLEKVLKETNFEEEFLFYDASY